MLRSLIRLYGIERIRDLWTAQEEIQLTKMSLSKDYKITHSLKGYKPLLFLEEKLLVYKQGYLYLMDLHSLNIEKLTKMARPLWEQIFSLSRIMTRLLRLEPRGATVYNDHVYFAYQRKLYQLKMDEMELKSVHEFRPGMRAPLGITVIRDIPGFDNMVCYGEYFGNPKMEPVNVFAKIDGSEKWESVYRFEEGEINHIHAIVPDKFNSRVWVLTGDVDEAAGIWYTDDNFRTLNKFLLGQQTYRTCSLFPYDGGFIYATDTPLQDNHIFSVTIENKELSLIQDINGSCIYSTMAGNKIVLSTTVEGSTKKCKLANLLFRQKGPGIKSWFSDLLIGDKEEGFQRIVSFEKDYYPTALLQFGTLIFPHGKNESGKIVVYGSSVKKVDGLLFILEQNL